MPLDRDHAFADGVAYPRPKSRAWLQRLFASPPARRAAEAWARFDAHAAVARGCLLGPNAWCVNSRGPREAITLAEGVICRGLLRTERFGAGRIVLESHAYIGDDVLLSSSAQITVGERALLAHGVQVFDNDSHPRDPAARVSDYEAVRSDGAREAIAAAPIAIGPRAWIGFNAIILKGVTIGEGSIVAAGSVVTRDIPPHSVAAGHPAAVIRTLDHVPA